MKWLLPVVLVWSVVAAPAHAISCPSWTRLTRDQREAQIARMIHQVVRSHAAQQYHVNKGRVARCLERNAYRIEDDFDDACADRRTAGMRALDNIFNRYVWSCVR